MKPGGSQRGPFGWIFHQSPITSDEHPSFGRFAQEVYPFQIGRVPTVRQPRNVTNMKCRMAFVLDEAMQSRCENWRGTVIEKDLHAANRCSMPASKSMARRTAVIGTS